ncbi:MAG: hypothetical protein FWE33_08250 [Defluviitaleaceae bacterium]|nr:hypothetical protein [Defluviitaleaceae bacterium]
MGVQIPSAADNGAEDERFSRLRFAPTGANNDLSRDYPPAYFFAYSKT